MYCMFEYNCIQGIVLTVIVLVHKLVKEILRLKQKKQHEMIVYLFVY